MLTSDPISHLLHVLSAQDQFSQIKAVLQEIADNVKPEDYHRVTDVGLFIATLALAIVTWRLFSATRDVASRTADLAGETVDATLVADIHHQEAHGAIVVWSGVRQIRTDGLMFGYLVNVGFGPAVDV